jgi:hypothetical protein
MGDVVPFVFERPEDWIMLRPGRTAFARRALPEIPKGARQASFPETALAHGHPFPWGNLPDLPNPPPFGWEPYRMGPSGIYFDKWFVTTDGRVGGASNVPTHLPGSARSCFLYDGGPGGLGGNPNVLAENEGYAVVAPVDDESFELYRVLQHHAARHVVADGGGIILSPFGHDRHTVFVGFVGKCLQGCLNMREVSFPQAKAVVEERFGDRYDVRLFPEFVSLSAAKKLRVV